MPKLPYRSKKKSSGEEDVVSFRSYTDGRADSLTLNDNINYQLHYEKRSSVASAGAAPASKSGSRTELRETSLSAASSAGAVAGAPKPPPAHVESGKFYPRTAKYAFLDRMKRTAAPIRRQRSGEEAAGEEKLKYERFPSDRRGSDPGPCDRFPALGSGALALVVVCVLCVAVWWGVWGVVGGAWGEEHYRRLWERAHPHNQQQQSGAAAHYSPSVIVHQQLERLDPMPPPPPPPPPAAEPPPPTLKYHDHNNLSTKNRNVSEILKQRQRAESNESEFKKATGSNNNQAPIGEAMSDKSSEQCVAVSDEMRFDCYPENGASEQACVARGCCWIPHNRRKPSLNRFKLNTFASSSADDSIGLPYCFYPYKYGNYQVTNVTSTLHGITAYLVRQFQSSYPGDVNVVIVSVKFLSEDSLQIKIYDAEKHRFEPPYPEIPIVSSSSGNLKYTVSMETSKLGFKIVRKIDNTVIMDTQDLGGFIFSDKFLQISSMLPSSNIYGLGEHQGRFLLKTDWQRYTMFNFDAAPVENKNLYGTHPFYMVVEDSGRSHGVLLLNSNAMDVILQPAPAITFRSVGGVFNFFVMLGPEPNQVVSQYTSLIGRPFMPPYWSLGFHLCKYDYGSLNKTKEVWKRTIDAGIPFDVQWNDIDYMNNSNIFTYDKVLYHGLPEFVDHVHEMGMHYVLLIDPGVSGSEAPGTYPPFERGLDMNVFVKNSTDQPFVGKVWNTQSTVWPDFTNPNTTGYWVEMLASLHKKIAYDGIWIDMNEPSNFLSGPIQGTCKDENLPYLPGIGGSKGLKSGTLCMDAKHYMGSHYDLHNLYSLTEAVATNFALTEIRAKRPFIISRSSFPGLGKFAGHWSGDIFSEWYDMKMSIPQMLSFSLFGIPMMGADICGFNGNTTAELCRRWMELGAFYPFSRNHNSDKSIEQDPVSLGPAVVNASRRALTARYTMLPYLYTLFFKANHFGDTVARPLFFEFPRDNLTYPIDQQFMWGPHVMFAPVLEPDASSTKAYVPKATWYDYRTFGLLDWTGWGTLGEDETILLRGGGVLPFQTPDAKGGEPINTSRLRSRPLQLVVALDNVKSAKGTLFWDDGESLNTFAEKKYSLINFSAYGDTLKSEILWWGYGVPSVDRIYILGNINKVNSVVLNNKDVHFAYNKTLHVLAVYDLKLSLNDVFTLKWK